MSVTGMCQTCKSSDSLTHTLHVMGAQPTTLEADIDTCWVLYALCKVLRNDPAWSLPVFTNTIEDFGL